MNEKLPSKTAVLTTPKDTYIEAAHALQDGYLLYQPDRNAFIALYPEEFFEVRKVGEANNHAIEELQRANQDVTAKSLALTELLRNPAATQAELRQAQAELDQSLATLSVKSDAAKSRIEKITDLKVDQKKLTELLPLTMERNGRQKAFYIPVERLKSAAADRRVYLVEGKAERNKGSKAKLFHGTTLNVDEVRRRMTEQVVDKAKFEKKWRLKPKDGDEYAGQFFSDWSRTMGATAQSFLEREQHEIVEGTLGKVNSDPRDPHRRIDLKAEAQLMRWAAGAGLEANFLPFQGNVYDKRDKDWKSRFKRAAKAAQFNIKANAEASFAVGEARVQTIAYYPHFAGWHLTPAGAGLSLDLGHFRCRGEMTLYAVAGASIALEASAGLLLTASEQGLRGVPKHAKAVKAKASAEGKVELFAGLKEGIDLSGGLQWLNPEGFIDEKSPKRKDVTKTWGEYVDIGKVSAGVAGIEGLAASLGFEVGYKDGNFVIAAKADLCLGLGGSGNVSCKATGETIAQLFMCLAHQLKQADYSKLTGLMEPIYFQAFNQILYMVQVGDTRLNDFVDSGVYRNVTRIQDAYEDAMVAVSHKGERFLRELQQTLHRRWGWFAYMPPEARGAVIASIVDIADQPQYINDRELRQLAAFSVNELLATAQTDRHLRNTLDRVTVNIGRTGDRSSSVVRIAALLADSTFAGGLERAEIQVATAEALVQRPFARNDEPSFIIAQMGLSHVSTRA